MAAAHRATVEATCNELSHELKALKANNTLAQHEREQFEQLQADLTESQANLEKEKSKGQAVQQIIAEKKEDYEHRIAHMERVSASVREDLAEAQGLGEKQVAMAVESAQAEIDSNVAENIALQERVADLTKDLQKASNKDFEGIADQLEAAQKDAAKVTADFNHAQNEIAELERLKRNLNNELAVSKKQNDDYKKLTEDLKAKAASNTRAPSKAHQREQADLEAANQDLTDRVAKLDAALERAGDQTASLRDQLVDERSKKVSTETDDYDAGLENEYRTNLRTLSSQVEKLKLQNGVMVAKEQEQEALIRRLQRDSQRGASGAGSASSSAENGESQQLKRELGEALAELEMVRQEKMEQDTEHGEILEKYHRLLKVNRSRTKAGTSVRDSSASQAARDTSSTTRTDALKAPSAVRKSDMLSPVKAYQQKKKSTKFTKVDVADCVLNDEEPNVTQPAATTTNPTAPAREAKTRLTKMNSKMPARVKRTEVKVNLVGKENGMPASALAGSKSPDRKLARDMMAAPEADQTEECAQQ